MNIYDRQTNKYIDIIGEFDTAIDVELKDGNTYELEEVAHGLEEKYRRAKVICIEDTNSEIGFIFELV